MNVVSWKFISIKVNNFFNVYSIAWVLKQPLFQNKNKKHKKQTNDARTGSKMVAVAVFEVISVKNVNIVLMMNTIAAFGITFNPANWQLSHRDKPDS